VTCEGGSGENTGRLEGFADGFVTELGYDGSHRPPLLRSSDEKRSWRHYLVGPVGGRASRDIYPPCRLTCFKTLLNVFSRQAGKVPRLLKTLTRALAEAAWSMRDLVGAR
jgi:hypothetical protein